MQPCARPKVLQAHRAAVGRLGGLQLVVYALISRSRTLVFRSLHPVAHNAALLCRRCLILALVASLVPSHTAQLIIELIHHQLPLPAPGLG